MMIPFLALLVFSALLDLIRYFILTLAVPWRKILTIEGLGLFVLVLYDLFLTRMAGVVLLFVRIKLTIGTGLSNRSR